MVAVMEGAFRLPRFAQYAFARRAFARRAVRLALSAPFLSLLTLGAWGGGAAAAHGAGRRVIWRDCWVEHGAFLVPAAFGELTGAMILDPGRAQSALHDTPALASGLSGASATGAFSLAGARPRAVTLPIQDLDPETADLEVSAFGVIGADLLAGEVITLDLRHGACRMSRDPRAARLARGGGEAALRSQDGGLAISTRITDGAKVREGMFRIDGARAETSVWAARLSRAPSKGEATPPIRLRAVEAAGAFVEAAPARLIASGDPSAQAVGTELWRGGVLTLDLRRKQVFFRPGSIF
jgi:hypothetical protein